MKYYTRDCMNCHGAFPKYIYCDTCDGTGKQIVEGVRRLSNSAYLIFGLICIVLAIVVAVALVSK